MAVDPRGLDLKRYLIFSLPLALTAMGWSLPAVAQIPLIDCATTYDCCVKRQGASNCAPIREGAVQSIADDTASLLEAGLVAEDSNPNATLATAIHGDKVNGLLRHVARHLARILDLQEVGGEPPGEPTREETKKHWWREVKSGVKNIHQALKRCRSRKQLLAAIQDAADTFTEAQVADIEARFAQAARKMGEEAGELFPCGKE